MLRCHAFLKQSRTSSEDQPSSPHHASHPQDQSSDHPADPLRPSKRAERNRDSSQDGDGDSHRPDLRQADPVHAPGAHGAARLDDQTQKRGGGRHCAGTGRSDAGGDQDGADLRCGQHGGGLKPAAEVGSGRRVRAEGRIGTIGCGRGGPSSQGRESPKNVVRLRYGRHHPMKEDHLGKIG